ncbi:MAG: DUF89 family protein, partial [Candidatus Omnitrophica bacterium]|nr:DUF89 family protein [Candidatus Omnitrophota bacterium]
MRTYLECIPCFFKQALEAARICSSDPAEHKKILDEVAGLIGGISLGSSPPEMGRTIHSIIKERMRVPDPYREIKEKSNRMALRIYPGLKEKVAGSRDPLLTAVELAVAGNIIDYGVKNTLNVEEEIEKILKREIDTIKKEDSRFFNYGLFREKMEGSKDILYLADNAGEAVFDRVLIEEIVSMKGKKITYAVKERPIINDATEKDALDCGIDRIARVVSSGSDAPGTVLPLCSKDFLERFESADMIISKGQGNFEALSGEKRPVFYLFMAKCAVVVKDVGC